MPNYKDADPDGWLCQVTNYGAGLGAFVLAGLPIGFHAAGAALRVATIVFFASFGASLVLAGRAHKLGARAAGLWILVEVLMVLGAIALVTGEAVIFAPGHAIEWTAGTLAVGVLVALAERRAGAQRSLPWVHTTWIFALAVLVLGAVASAIIVGSAGAPATDALPLDGVAVGLSILGVGLVAGFRGGALIGFRLDVNVVQRLSRDDGRGLVLLPGRLHAGALTAAPPAPTC